MTTTVLSSAGKFKNINLNSIDNADIGFLLDHCKKRGKNVDASVRELRSIDTQLKLDEAKIEVVCPYCNGSNHVKDGKRNKKQVYKCKTCGKKFTRFTGTLLANSKYSWDEWVWIISLVLKGTTLDKFTNEMKNHFGKEFEMSRQTAHRIRLKILYAISELPKEKLKGVISADEVVIRESQTGSRKLISRLHGVDIRNPRRRYTPSRYGPLSTEFSTIITTVDDRGYVINNLMGFGAFKLEKYVDVIKDQLGDVIYFCTDGNPSYIDFAKLMGYKHFVSLSGSHKAFEDSDYVYYDVYKNNTDKKIIKKNNIRIINELYDSKKIDHIVEQKLRPLEIFNQEKNLYGLSINRVNAHHNVLKLNIQKKCRNVASKYLGLYAQKEAFTNNWNVKYPNKKAHTLEAAEEILLRIIKRKINITVDEIIHSDAKLPAPSGHYQRLVMEREEEARLITQNKHVRFDNEMISGTFDRRKYLRAQPKATLRAMAKELGLKGYLKWVKNSLEIEIMHHPDGDKIMYQFMDKMRKNVINLYDSADAMGSNEYEPINAIRGYKP